MPLTTVSPGLLEPTAQYYGFKNRFINGAFSIWQRGTSFSNPASGAFTYTADRWGTFVSGTGSTATISQQPVPAGTFTGETFEPSFFARYAVTAVGSATYRDFAQRIEDVQALAGKTVTLSFYARAAASITVTPYWYQVFGTGGPADTTATGTALTIGTTWQKYSVSINIAATTGKTLGPSNTSFTAVGLIFPNTVLTLDLALMQVEVGSSATSFDYRPYATELQLCQRYFEKSYDVDTAPGTATTVGFLANGGFYAGPSASYGIRVGTQYKVTKRASPLVITYDGAGNANRCNFPDTTTNIVMTVIANGQSGFTAETAQVTTTQTRVYWHYTSSAEL